MAKNRKMSKKMSVIAQGSTMLCAVIVMLFVMVVVNLLADSSCSQLMKSIGAKEAQLKRLNDDCSRESARWEEMTTPDRLEAALKRHGLAMRYANAAQNIRMNAAGKPEPGQFAVSRMEQRSHSNTAAYRPAAGGSRPKRH